MRAEFIFNGILQSYKGLSFQPDPRLSNTDSLLRYSLLPLASHPEAQGYPSVPGWVAPGDIVSTQWWNTTCSLHISAVMNNVTVWQSQKGVGEFLLEEGDDLLHHSPCDFAVISNNHALFPSISAIDPYQQSKFDLDNEDATVSEDQRLNNCFILLLCFTFQLASKQLSIDHIDQVKRQVSFSLCSSNRNN